jgi:transketolase
MLSIVELESIAESCRSTAIDIAEKAGSGHLGGSLSIMDVLVVLKFRVMKENDVLVYSKAHASEALYAVLFQNGSISRSELETFCEWGSRLQSHTEHWAMSDIEFSGGSLGQGLSFACGVALGKRLKGDTGRVFCIVGDGECQEGQVWEAMLFKRQYALDNLCVIIDWNKNTGDSKDIREVMDVEVLINSEDLVNIMVDGHKMDRIVSALTDAYYTVIVMSTIKGKGVKLWETSHSHLQYGEELKKGIEEWRKNEC